MTPKCNASNARCEANFSGQGNLSGRFYNNKTSRNGLQYSDREGRLVALETYVGKYMIL